MSYLERLAILTIKQVKIKGFLLILFLPFTVLAENSNELNALAMNAYAQAAAQMPEVSRSLAMKAANQAIKKMKTPMVFVSLGMPDELLKQILIEAHQLNLSVVIRGVYQNSFDKTLKRLSSLMPSKDSTIQAGGILINPVWFKEYQITTVPAVVVPYDNDDFDVVFGNITLKEALNIIKTHHRKKMEVI